MISQSILAGTGRVVPFVTFTTDDLVNPVLIVELTGSSSSEGDNISDNEEDGAPNNGDGNNEEQIAQHCHATAIPPGAFQKPTTNEYDRKTGGGQQDQPTHPLLRNNLFAGE